MTLFNPKPKKHRSGSAVVELSICLPVMALLTFGTIEICSVIYLKQALEIACYEGVRIGVAPEKYSKEAKKGAERILKERNIKNYSVSVSPSKPDKASFGDEITVTAEASIGENTLFAFGLVSKSKVTCSATMLKE